MYCSPPKHGSSVVRTVLSDSKLTAQFYQICTKMADRIQSMRTRLVDALTAAGEAPHDSSHVTNQNWHVGEQEILAILFVDFYAS